MLERFGIEQSDKVVRQYPHMLSGGMRQRALIAMGVFMDTPVVFADEPTKGLDWECIQIVEKTFKAFAGKTILCVTHDLRFAKDVADYICILYGGQLIEVSDAKSFFNEPLHPYSKALISALPENGLKVTVGFAPPHTAQVGQCKFLNRCIYCTEKCRTSPPMIKRGTRKVRCFLYAD